MAKAKKTEQKPKNKVVWIWTGLNGLLLLGVLALLAMLFLSGEGLRNAAKEQGQRIEFAIVDGQAGDIQGKLISLAEATGQETPTETPPAPEPTQTVVDSVVPAATDPMQTIPDATSPATPEMAVEPAATYEVAEPPAAPAGPSKVQQQTQEGVLPVIAADGTMAWQHYAKGLAGTPPPGPKIAVVLYRLGLGTETTKSAVALPPAVTLSFSPYSRNITEWVEKAHASGHEILLDLPAQTERYPAMDPGPFGLLNDLSVEENYKRLRQILSKTGHYVGLLTPLRETLSQDNTVIASLVSMLGKHGLLLLSSATDVPMALSEAAGNAAAPVLHADIILDEKILEPHIQGQLAKLEELAQKQGFAIGVGRAFPVTVELLASWSESLQAKGITLVPVTAATRNQP